MKKDEIGYFVGKDVGLLYKDTERDVFLRGTIVKVGDTTLLFQTKNGMELISLDALVKIKEGEKKMEE